MGRGNFFVALLLCFVLIGLLIFVYMAIVKPPGTLTVVYQRSAQAAPSPAPDRAPAAPDAAEGRQAIRRLSGV
jgi:hypothetical protein